MMAAHVTPLFLVALLLAAGSALAAPTALETKLAQAKADPAVPFTVLYDDLHPFHGGMSISVSRDGSIERVDVVRRKKSVTKARATPEQISALLDLLVEVGAWEQQIPERRMVHDESKATLAVSAGGQPGGFWEWYNDLAQNARLIRVKAALEQLAPAPAEASP